MNQREINEGENYRLWWDEDHRIARGKVMGQMDILAAEIFASAVEKMYQEHGKVDWLIDLSEGGKPPSSRTRKILADGMSSAETGMFVFFGASILLRTVANFLSQAAGKTDSRYFATEEAALEWIFARRG